MSVSKIRFGDYIHRVSLRQRPLSYNQITSHIDAEGPDYASRRIRTNYTDAYRLTKMFLYPRISAQLRAVLPLAAYLFFFQLIILRQVVVDASVITAGLVAVIVGLMFFMEGLKIGLMPFGKTIGSTLPRKSSLPVVLVIVAMLGVGVTFAEPAIGALQQAGALIDVKTAPYLYALLNDYAMLLVIIVGVGVGLAAVLGTIRFVYSWSLKPLVYLTLIPTLLLSGYIAYHPDLSVILGLAWDCGAVTTGPVTVPLVLALGIGIASATSSERSNLSGFGIVTLASLFPILCVMLLGVYLTTVISPAEIISGAATHAAKSTLPAWYEISPTAEVIGGFRAIIPLVLFLVFIFRLLLKERVQHPNIIFYGIVLTVLGMILFNLGLSYGLTRLGSQSGSLVPAAFIKLEHVADSPLYVFSLGLFIAGLFAWLLGFGATLAEPALNALGLTVEDLTSGAFKKRLLMVAVSVGVACGITLGIAKIIFNIPLIMLVVPLYLLALILTYCSTEEFVNIAWDSAGVTTGPVTVPLVLAMGLGFGKAMDATEGFGILTLASIGPIISVLATGLFVHWRTVRAQRLEASELE